MVRNGFLWYGGQTNTQAVYVLSGLMSRGGNRKKVLFCLTFAVEMPKNLFPHRKTKEVRRCQPPFRPSTLLCDASKPHVFCSET